jgi:hypothetical protein
MKTEKRRRMPRQMVHSRLEEEVFRRLKAYTAATGAEDSATVNAAVAQYLDKTSDTALILRRLDRISRREARTRRELDALSEVLTTFIQVWFAHTKQLEPDERKAAQQFAKERFSEMFEYLRKRISGPKRFLVDLLGPEDTTDSRRQYSLEPNGAADVAGE